MWVEKGEGRREWGWEEKGEEERKMNHFPDLVIFDSIIPSERNSVNDGRLLGARSRQKGGPVGVVSSGTL